MSNNINRRGAGMGDLRRNARGPSAQTSAAFTPQIEVISNGITNLVCSNGIQVIVGGVP